ncbi:10461_t:CDS:2 [Paraglomus occultum]|uniref:10461_t:CDS:1 n=1 Tax=Paraglomus occultum TaxID=144539 RepID=A0A9N8ZA15_9GLOM|nr:10461_t:CDS:2 [Paraglomus occultum]
MTCHYNKARNTGTVKEGEIRYKVKSAVHQFLNQRRTATENVSTTDGHQFLNWQSTAIENTSTNTSTDINAPDMRPPKAWYKLVKPESAWDKIPLLEVEDVSDLKNAIKKAMSPKLDLYPAADLILKASKFDNKDAGNAIEFDSESQLESILKYFGVEQTPIHQSFAANIRLFLSAQDERRKFAAATEADPVNNFYIEPKILENFASYLLNRQFCLLFGHRQSGKTTICHALLRWFYEHPEKFTEFSGCNPDDFDMHVVTFDATVRADQGSKVFWKAVCERLYSLDKSRIDVNLPATSSGAFLNFFSKRNHPSSKPVILLIDEASRLTSVGGETDVTNEVTDEFISVLRSLKNAHDYSLHGLALVGTESIRELLVAHNKPGASSQISPFSQEATWMAGRFTKAEVEELFGQFAKDRSSMFDSVNIATDVFELTLGHKGLVGACGAYVQQGYDFGSSPIITLDDWKKYTPVELRRFIVQKQHYDSIVRSLGNLSPASKSILMDVLGHGICEVDPTKEATKYLLAEGMVYVKEERSDGSAIIECAAPILRGLMLSHISMRGFNLSRAPPDEKEIDLQWLLYAPQFLNADGNPSEYSFQSEFATVFRHLLPLAYPVLRYKTIVEVKERNEDGRRSQRLDILIRNGSDLPSYGFELVVAASRPNFDEHHKRAHDYGKLHGCRHVLMVNLCPKVTLSEYFGKMNYDNVTPANVVIKPNEFKGVIRFEENDEHVSITGTDWDMMFNSDLEYAA